MKNKYQHQITEAINLNEVTSVLLYKGYMLYRPEVDKGGVDFLIETPSGQIQKCQLKSRAYVEWNRYGAKDSFMVFPGKGEKGKREWYKIPHDDLFSILKAKHGKAPKWNNPKYGEYWHCEVSKDLAEELENHSISNTESSDYSRKLYRNDELKPEWFLLDAKKDFEKVLEVGYSINGYDVLPKHSDIDISRALRKEFLEDPESISELISLRLILFFELRYLNKKFEVVDKDYERINLILKNIYKKL